MSEAPNVSQHTKVTLPVFSNLTEEDDDAWYLDDLESVRGSSCNVSSKVFEVGSELNRKILSASSNSTSLLVTSLRSHAQIPDLENRVSGPEDSVDVLLQNHDDAHEIYSGTCHSSGGDGKEIDVR